MTKKSFYIAGSISALKRNVLLWVMLLPLISVAQFYNGSQMSFGKNRVQFKEFFWTYYKYEKYDVYFYLGGQELALYTAKYVEEHLEEIEDKLDTSVDDKMQFIVYNTLTDLKQSNIGLIQNESYNTGGVTHIIGKKVFLYFNGSHEHFDHQIRAGIAQTVVNQLLYGSSIGSQIKNTSLFPFPDWYMNGLVSYISEDWNTEIDNKVRDGILSGRFDKFNRLTGEEATWAGHAFWRYIAEKYGKSSISNIIYMAKVSRRLESGFLYILGISFKNLVEETLTYYRELYEQSEEGREFPDEYFQKKMKDNVVFEQVKVSPTGDVAAYVWNKSGKYKVYLKDLVTGKRKKVLKNGYRLDEKVDYSYPIIAWHPSGRILAMLIEKKGEPQMRYYLFDEKKTETVILYQFEKVLDFAYSPDGRSMAMSAVVNGQSDIFIYDVGSNSFEQITMDNYDDLYPRFVGRSNIVFSSNRTSDTIRFERKYDPKKAQERYDLFLYREDDNILRRVTKTPLSNEIMAMPYEKNYITYLSDQNGIYNRYIGWFDSAISYIDTTTHYRYFTNSFPVTDYSRNILEHDVNPQVDKIGQVLYKDRLYYLQVTDRQPVSSLRPLDLQNTQYKEQLFNLYGKSPDIKPKKEAKAGETRGSKKRGFKTVRQSDALKELLGTDTIADDDGNFDINNYQFDIEQREKNDNINWDFTDIQVALPGQKGSDKDEPPKRLNYNVEYFINEITTQIDFSYLNQNYQNFTGGQNPIYLNPGFNALFKVGVTDLLEDYRIVGGVRLNLNLINNEYLLSFTNLKKRMDKEIVFHRQVNEFNYSNLAFLRVYTHELHYSMKYPFSPVLALKSTITYKHERGVALSTDATTLSIPNESSNTAILKEELIYDDTKNLGLNLFDGTRFKIFGEYHQTLEPEFFDYRIAIVGMDFRHYIPIHRMLIWANRFAASTSFSKYKLIYYMGGVDNWLFPKFSTNTPVDLENNYIYQTLATNMRGFKQNIRNGNSFAVINTEIRWPVIRYFANTPIKSDFLNNLQIVGFGDIGTAWTGLHPYSEDNYLFTNHIRQTPLNITVKVQKEPIVGGFGFGARTRLLGYFIRADLAWGVEDYQVQPSVFYLSLSLDF
ncbi:MAG: PD40 domain-containing protein [Bacteroidales bacterium]|nr:PD40 domain-containing protein [Bacteroidales bacterium]